MILSHCGASPRRLALVVAALLVASPAGMSLADTVRTTPGVDARRARLLEVLGPQARTPEDRAALMQKLAGLKSEVVIHDGREGGLGDIDVDAVSCGRPCSSGGIDSIHPFFNVVADCDTGAFGLRTGGSHPATIAAGAPQSLTFDGAALDTSGGEITWFVHEDGLAFTNPTGGQACVFDPPDTADEPQSSGIEQEWTVSPNANVTLVLRHEIVSFGSQASNAGLRLTLSATNDATSASSATVGVRWWLDTMLADDDGPLATAIDCSPLVDVGEWQQEHEIALAEMGEYLRLRSSTGPSLEVAAVTTAVTGFPGAVAPTRLIVARWANALGAAWDYVPSEGDGTDSDAVLIVYHGHDTASAVVLAPGESFTRSLVLVADCDRSSSCQPPIFDVTSDPVPACQGEVTTLTGSVSVPGLGAFDYRWVFGDGSPDQAVADPTVPVQHVYTAMGPTTATLVATSAGDPTCQAIDTVVVSVEPGTPPTGSMGSSLRVRRSGTSDVELGWATATVVPPSFIVFRTDTPSEGVLTPTGIGDETVVARTTALSAIDANVVGRPEPLLCYIVLPMDTCGAPVFP